MRQQLAANPKGKQLDFNSKPNATLTLTLILTLTLTRQAVRLQRERDLRQVRSLLPSGREAGGHVLHGAAVLDPRPAQPGGHGGPDDQLLEHRRRVQAQAVRAARLLDEPGS